jgi:hypothetical protein
MSAIDFGRHSEDYSTYRPGFTASFYQRIDKMICIREIRSLDLATGPGTIALELGTRGSSVVGTDTSADQIATAERVAKERILEEVEEFCYDHDEEFSHTCWRGRIGYYARRSTIITIQSDELAGSCVDRGERRAAFFFAGECSNTGLFIDQLSSHPVLPGPPYAPISERGPLLYQRGQSNPSSIEGSPASMHGEPGRRR